MLKEDPDLVFWHLNWWETFVQILFFLSTLEIEIMFESVFQAVIKELKKKQIIRRDSKSNKICDRHYANDQLKEIAHGKKRLINPHLPPTENLTMLENEMVCRLLLQFSIVTLLIQQYILFDINLKNIFTEQFTFMCSNIFFFAANPQLRWRRCTWFNWIN